MVRVAASGSGWEWGQGQGGGSRSLPFWVRRWLLTRCSRPLHSRRERPHRVPGEASGVCGGSPGGLAALWAGTGGDPTLRLKKCCISCRRGSRPPGPSRQGGRGAGAAGPAAPGAPEGGGRRGPCGEQVRGAAA